MFLGSLGSMCAELTSQLYCNSGAVWDSTRSSMEHSSEEDSDISESEMLKYEDKSYKKLKSGNHSVKISDEAFTCPYCPKKRKQEYLYKDRSSDTLL